MYGKRLADNGPKTGRRLMTRYVLGSLLGLLGLQLTAYFYYKLEISYDDHAFWDVVASIGPTYLKTGWIYTVLIWLYLFPPLLLYLLPKMESLRYGGVVPESAASLLARRFFWTHRRFAALCLLISFLMAFGYIAPAAIGGYVERPPTVDEVTFLGFTIPGPGSGEPLSSRILHLAGVIAVCTVFAWALCFALIQPIAIAGLHVLDRRKQEPAREVRPAPPAAG